MTDYYCGSCKRNSTIEHPGIQNLCPSCGEVLTRVPEPSPESSKRRRGSRSGARRTRSSRQRDQDEKLSTRQANKKLGKVVLRFNRVKIFFIANTILYTLLLVVTAWLYEVWKQRPSPAASM